MNLKDSAAYSIAFKKCCEEEFGMSDSRLRQLVKDHANSLKRIKELETMNHRKIVHEFVLNISSAGDDSPYISTIIEAMKKLGYYESASCIQCKYQAFCEKKVSLNVGDRVLELKGCSAGVPINKEDT